MGDKAQLLALAERVEAATGADRLLDAQIWLAVAMGEIQSGIARASGIWPKGCSEEEWSRRESLWITDNAPRFSASLDAALALCPQGHWWNVGQDTDFAWANLTPWGTDKTIEALNCATPALALCAAALKARAASETRP